MLTNWKTTLAGVGAICAALGHLATAISTGDTGSLVADVSAIIAGLGLITAKDAHS